MSIGEVIKELRLEKALSQRKLGKAVGVLDSAVSKWERGATEPDVTTIIKLVKFFDVTADYLLGLED